MLNLLDLKYNNVSLIPCTRDLLMSFIIPNFLAEHAIFAVVTYTNLHFHMVIYYDKLCFGPHCPSLRYELKKHVKTSAHTFPLFLRDIFSFVRRKSEKERKEVAQ